jgi:hypothetical protein
MAYNAYMIFIETSLFTKEIQRLLPDESYRMLQSVLMLRPDAGSVIRGSGGLRKIRWSVPGSGKRGHCESFTFGVLRTLSSCSFRIERMSKKA